MKINKNAIRLKVGQNSTSSTTLNVDENQFIKSQGTQTINTSGVQSLFDDSKLVDDYFLKGSYKVVSDIDCRNNIPCEYRKLGMQVMVVGPDASFKRYVLKGNDPCSNEGWEEVLSTTNEVDVKLVEDYSVLGDSLNTQRDLNLKLKQSILNLQTQINNIELIDEKVQITEDTSFAQIGESQKDFNKNVSDYKINADLKNQEQDDRLTAIEGENVAQYDLINDLSSELDFERVRNDAQDSRLINLEGINYTWSPTNRTLTLFDKEGNQLSQVSLVSLYNEVTDLLLENVYNKSDIDAEFVLVKSEINDVDDKLTNLQTNFTNMLSVVSRSQQLSLSSIFRVNQDGNANKVDVTAGVLFSQTLDKTWNVSALVTTLPDNDYRYVYAKASKTTSVASIYLSKNKILFDSDVNDFYFLVGILHSVVDGVRVLSITIGTATISGGLVRTGIISSLDGLTSFNLNTGEIKGKITFMSSDGDYKDLDDTIKDVSSKVNYRVEITSTNGNFFKNDIIETTLIAKVYYGSEDITDSLPQNSFRWKRVSSDSVSDNAWNLLHQDFGSNILAISSIDVENRAVFNCEVNI